MKVKVSWLAAAVALAVVCGGTAPVLAEVHVVEVRGDNTYFPDAVTIAVGDTVRWTWVGGFHDVKSGVGGVHDGNFDSGSPGVGLPDFDVVFDEAFLTANPMPDNIYPYYCSVHVAQGMDGTVTVEAPIPTMSEWGLIIMGVLVVGAAVVLIRRQRALAA